MKREVRAPAWEFGLTTYAFLEGNRIACIFGLTHRQRLGIVGAEAGRLEPFDLPFTG
jgi:hypothetical protein